MISIYRVTFQFECDVFHMTMEKENHIITSILLLLKYYIGSKSLECLCLIPRQSDDIYMLDSEVGTVHGLK